jgi:putative oxidoreductase
MSGAPVWGTALLRVILGVIFVMHGYLALAVLTPAGAAGYFTRMGYPPGLAVPLAWYLVVVHLGGGALLVIGLWTRLAALLQVPIMASAVFLFHFPQGFFLRGIILDAAKDQAVAGGYEYALLVLAATLAQALLGEGALSVDARRRRRGPTRVP